jgi:hypothetical protein
MYRKNGSLTIIVLIAMSCFQIIICLLLFTSSSFFGFIKAKNDHEQLYHLAQGLYLYAVSEADWKTFLQSPKRITTIIKIPWPDKRSCYEGHVWIEKVKHNNKNIIVVHSDLIRNKKVLISLKA